MRVAIVHYWLVGMRGGEKVVEALCEMFPEADIYTNAFDEARISDTIKRHHVTTTFVGRLPFATRLYQLYLPLMPLALEHLDLSGYDLIISSESGPAKNVIASPEALHVCYCHSPMRYLWDMQAEYTARLNWFVRLLAAPVLHYLRECDVVSASRVDAFVANSSFIAKRINRAYRRHAEVIFPPVDIDDFYAGDVEEPEDFYLFFGQLVPYKRADLAVEAFSQSGRRLVVAGQGSELKRLQHLAGPSITFVGRLSDAEVRSYLRRCKALIHPGKEDFGIVPVEAMAAGRPVIAYHGGGACDSVVEGVSGLFFSEQTVEALNTAVDNFEYNFELFTPQIIAKLARRFSKARFQQEFAAMIDRLMQPQPSVGGPDSVAGLESAAWPDVDAARRMGGQE